MKNKFKKILNKTSKNLPFLNFLLILVLLTLFGFHMKIGPFETFKQSILKPLLKPTTASPEMSKRLVKDQEIERKIDAYWNNIEQEISSLGQQVDYGGGIDWKRHIFWLNELKKGGYIILMRHGEREKWHEALAGFDAYELSNKINARNTDWYKAVCLTKRGIESVKNTGRSFREANIKIQKIISSPSCRARETAFYAFNRIDEIHSSLLHRTGIHPLDRYKYGQDLRKTLLNFKLNNDKNLFLSAHNSVIDFPDLIDVFNTSVGLDEGGFYIIEKVGTKLIARYKYHNGGVFNMIVYRGNPIKKICSNPKNPMSDCSSM